MGFSRQTKEPPMRVSAQVYDFSLADIDFITTELRRLLESRNFLTLGQYGEQFERAFATYHGAPYAVSTNNGTAALEIILRALGVAGGEVIVPANTFAATAFAAIHSGARPVFADILPDMTLDPADTLKRLTPRTRAVISVHIGGLISPATLELAELCRAHKIFLVEDAAHAHGSALDGKSAGTFGIAASFSFFSTKVMTTGEGGMILTADEDICRKARTLRDQGKVNGANYHEIIGYNWRASSAMACARNRMKGAIYNCGAH
jgi:dTDP-4-amino-4,6-dideoxygalactose transaminase